jgi:hypothetical protein
MMLLSIFALGGVPCNAIRAGLHALLCLPMVLVGSHCRISFVLLEAG